MRHLVRPVLAALGLAVSPCALAQDAVPVDQARYRACIAEIDTAPMAAYETGLAWQAQAGGWPAAHCTALAIVASGDYAEGAARLETNAEGAVAAGDHARAVMFGQAGDAWMAAGDPVKALRAFTRGRDFAPGDAGLAFGRAEAAIEAGLYEVAEEAAGEAIALAPDASDGYRLRGRARLELGELDAAEADMQAARERDPDSIEALLLRGDINEARRTAG
ncbi:tetratricopeptide repeat protein [Marinicauda algicola]|uniref:Tetratricopeptide repeat protein n=1 Tax=Marinicauda algicola TaxID=2029849 RepID=A0A4V3RY36_9PROT|nr:tetratricopeptide repeat protein [Marinicauda algicola]TGY88909.1 tetratricopeptide repeat protein [Marinicauda algicola]